jgi:hypothetical protein
MKIATLITSFALAAATSSAALAKPAQPVQPCEEPAVVVKPTLTMKAQWRRPDVERYERPLFINNTKLYDHASEYIGTFGAVPRGPALAALTEPTRIDRGAEHFVVRQGGFNTIQLRNVAGSSFIRQVTIEFMDGSAQIVNPQQSLDRRSSSITIDVKGENRSVKRILVYGSTANNSAYQLFAT